MERISDSVSVQGTELGTINNAQDHMLNDEDKKLYGVIFKAEDTVHSEAGGL